MKKMQPLTREFLLKRGFCCNNGCLNCPYKMKSLKTKQDLINTVLEQIKLDVDCRDITAIEELVKYIPTKKLISFLPLQDCKLFKHLEDEEIEIRTENAITNLITQFPNDQELGKQIRMRYGK